MSDRYTYFNYHLGKIVSGEVLDFDEWLAQQPAGSYISPDFSEAREAYDAYRNWSIVSPQDREKINIANLPSQRLTDRILAGAVTAVITAAAGSAGGAAVRALNRDQRINTRPLPRVPLPARSRRQTPLDFKRRLSTLVAQRLRLGTRRRFIPL